MRLIDLSVVLLLPLAWPRGAAGHDHRHTHHTNSRHSTQAQAIDPLLSAVQQTASIVQKDLSEIEKNEGEIVKQQDKKGLEKVLADQLRIVSAAETSADAYLTAEDDYHDRYQRYYNPALRNEVVAKITGAKSSLSFHQAALDNTTPNAQDKSFNDLKNPQQPPDPRGAQHASGNAASEPRGDAARRPGKDSSEGHPGKSAVWLGEDASGAGTGFERLDSRRLQGHIWAPGKGSPSASAQAGGRPLAEASAKPEAGQAAERLAQGEKLLSSGKSLEAMAWARKMIEADPMNPKGHRLLANALSKLGRHEEAEAAALEAVRLAPSDPEGYIALAWARLHLRKYEEALQAINTALSLAPDNAKALTLRALIYEQLGEREKMLADLRRASQLDPEKYGENLRRALAGQRLFDPSDSKSYVLLDGLLRPRGGRPGPMPWALAVGILGLLASIFIAVRKRRTAAVVHAKTADEAAPPPAVAAQSPGNGFPGKYRMTRQLGRTKRSEVWAAHDASLDRHVLARRLRFDEGETGERQRARALRDIRLLADLRHPGIERVLEIVELDREVTAVVEATPWATAEDWVKASGPLPFEKARAVMAKACEALAAAHERGLLHRCVTPAKLLVSEQGHVRLADIGSWGGCEPEYRAPETEGGAEAPATDIYSLGATLYALLSGSPPYDGDIPARRSKRDFKEPSARAPGIPPAVDSLVRDALDPDPAARPQSVRAFWERLSKA